MTEILNGDFSKTRKMELSCYSRKPQLLYDALYIK